MSDLVLVIEAILGVLAAGLLEGGLIVLAGYLLYRALATPAARRPLPRLWQPWTSLLAIGAALIGGAAEASVLTDRIMLPPQGGGTWWIIGFTLAAVAVVAGALALDGMIQHRGCIWGEAFAIFATISFLFVILLTVPGLPDSLSLPILAATVGGGVTWGTIDVVLSRRRISRTARPPVPRVSDEPDSCAPQSNCVTNRAEEAAAAPRLSYAAVGSLVCGVLTFTTFGATALPGLFLGIAGLVEVARNRGIIWGASFAMAGLLLCLSLFACVGLGGHP